MFLNLLTLSFFLLIMVLLKFNACAGAHETSNCILRSWEGCLWSLLKKIRRWHGYLVAPTILSLSGLADYTNIARITTWRICWGLKLEGIVANLFTGFLGLYFASILEVGDVLLWLVISKARCNWGRSALQKEREVITGELVLASWRHGCTSGAERPGLHRAWGGSWKCLCPVCSPKSLIYSCPPSPLQ